jgi:hypothetical protein
MAGPGRAGGREGAAARRGEEGEGVGDGHLEDVVDGAVAPGQLEDIVPVPAALAHLAVEAHVVEERQLDLEVTPTLALRARALGVEAEQRRRDAVGGGEHLANRVEHADVGSRVRAGRAADGALIDDDGLGIAPTASALGLASALGPTAQGLDEFGDERALARAGDSGDARQHALRYPDRDVAQVVGARVVDA